MTSEDETISNPSGLQIIERFIVGLILKILSFRCLNL